MLDNTVVIDFETYSPIPIEHGSHKYLKDREADIVFMGWEADNGEKGIWRPGESMPWKLRGADRIYSHGTFDWTAWHHIGCKKYGFPEWPMHSWIDSMALAQRYGYPPALDNITKILKTRHVKNPKGKALIKLISCPTVDGRRPELGRDFFTQDLQDYAEYCQDDVSATVEMISGLPADALSELEQHYWGLTQQMNQLGLPCDIEAVQAILRQIEIYTEEMQEILPDITNGVITKGTQTTRIVKFLNEMDVKIPDCAKETVATWLRKKDLPPLAKEILELRQILGKTSTAKYRTMNDHYIDGRVNSDMMYYGTSTGRYTKSMMLTLPRASVPDPQAMIDKYIANELVEDTINTAKALIRPMIRAHNGKKLMVADYAGIENRLLSWFADEQDVLDSIRRGEDQYKMMAKEIYHTPYDEVPFEERQVGKIAELGCGFGMGPDRFRDDAEANWGVYFEPHEASHVVGAYREKHYRVVAMWYKCSACVKNAILYPGQVYKAYKCKFSVVKDRNGRPWLYIQLPSGRKLYYAEPYVGTGKYGTEPRHYGSNSKTGVWYKQALIPGRIVENIVQATARDIMFNGMDNVFKHMPEVDMLGIIHDEGISEIAEKDIYEDTLERFYDNLCALPDWAEGLPLKAEGYIGERYKKG